MGSKGGEKGAGRRTDSGVVVDDTADDDVHQRGDDLSDDGRLPVVLGVAHLGDDVEEGGSGSERDCGGSGEVSSFALRLARTEQWDENVQTMEPMAELASAKVGFPMMRTPRS